MNYIHFGDGLKWQTDWWNVLTQYWHRLCSPFLFVHSYKLNEKSVLPPARIRVLKISTFLRVLAFSSFFSFYHFVLTRSSEFISRFFLLRRSSLSASPPPISSSDSELVTRHGVWVEIYNHVCLESRTVRFKQLLCGLMRGPWGLRSVDYCPQRSHLSLSLSLSLWFLLDA